MRRTRSNPATGHVPAHAASVRLAMAVASNLRASKMDDRAAILAIGDVHLGTSCSGVPDFVWSWGIDPGELTPAGALKRATDLAIERKVDAVLFAGDVVESANARFEAMPPLEECIRRLREEEVEVIAVAGNHDVDALPRLARLLDGFTLLGAGGRWESKAITRNNSPVAEIVGWSFGERFVRQSPVAELLSEPLAPVSTSLPRIGLLHADLNASGGHYAPVRQFELDDAGYDAWLLGHIHKPSIEQLSAGAASRPSGYLGSLVGLDPSETGPHGPWILKVHDGRELDLQHIPLAPLRWEQVSISVAGLDYAEDVADRLLSEATELVRRIGREGPAPRAVGLIARLTGSSSCHEDIGRRIDAGEWDALGRVVDGTAVFFSKIVAAMTPQLDLPEIAKGDDPTALMARRLMMLQQDDDRSRGLLDEARAALTGIASDERWSAVDEHRSATDPLSDQALRDVLLRSGMTALNAMLSQSKQGDR